MILETDELKGSKNHGYVDKQNQPLRYPSKTYNGDYDKICVRYKLLELFDVQTLQFSYILFFIFIMLHIIDGFCIRDNYDC